jgi:hypothetical protein
MERTNYYEILNSSNDDFAPHSINSMHMYILIPIVMENLYFYTSELNLNYEFSRPLVIDMESIRQQEINLYTFLSKDIAYFTSFNKTSLAQSLIFLNPECRKILAKRHNFSSASNRRFRFHPTISPNAIL